MNFVAHFILLLLYMNMTKSYNNMHVIFKECFEEFIGNNGNSKKIDWNEVKEIIFRNDGNVEVIFYYSLHN